MTAPSIRAVDVDADAVNVRALVGGHDVTIRLLDTASVGRVALVFVDGSSDPVAWIDLDTRAMGAGFAPAQDAR